MRLKALLTALSETVASTISTSSVLVVEDPTDLSLKDATGRAIVFMKSNGSKDFGIYFPEGTLEPVDGTEFVSDLVNNTFRLFR